MQLYLSVFTLVQHVSATLGLHPLAGTVTHEENYITRTTNTVKEQEEQRTKTYYKKDEWDSFNKNGELKFYI
jgi:hypothetical protein